MVCVLERKGQSQDTCLELGSCFEEIYGRTEGACGRLREADSNHASSLGSDSKKVIQLLTWGSMRAAPTAHFLSRSPQVPEAPSPVMVQHRLWRMRLIAAQTQEPGKGFSLITLFAFPSPKHLDLG